LTGGLINSGTVIANISAVFLGGTTLSDGLTNSGTIEGRSGIFLRSNNTLTGGLTNSGTINADERGINLNDNSTLTGGITNSGTIRSGTVGVGVILNNSTLTGGIANSGMIEGGNGKGRDGIGLGSADLTGGLANSGTIRGSEGVSLNNSILSDGLTNSGMIQGTNIAGIYLGTGTLAGGLTNSGTIDGGSYGGVYLHNNSTLAGGIINNGIIDSVRITTRIDTASSIFVSFVTSQLTGGLINNGTITDGFDLTGALLQGGLTNTGLLSSDSVAVSLFGITASSGTYVQDSTLTGGLTNSGTITAGSSYAAIYLDGGGMLSGGVTNSGTLDGYFGLRLRDSIIDGNVTNTGLVYGSENAFDLYGVSTITGDIINSGIISGNSGIHLDTQTLIVGKINNSGTIIGQGNAIEFFGDSILTGGLTNSGTITGNNFGVYQGGGTLSGGLTNAGTISGGGSGIFLGGVSLSGGLTNTGTINGDNVGGIYVSGGSLDALLNDTSGTITGNTGLAIVTGADVLGTVENRGVIQGDNKGLLFGHTGGQITGSLINSGTIIGGQYGIHLDGQTSANIVGGLTNTGLISGQLGILMGPDSTCTTSGCFAPTKIAVTGGITNSGTIQGTGGTALYMRGLFDTTPLVLQGGRIIGDVIDPNPERGFTPVTVTADFTTEGDFSVSSLTVNNGTSLTLDVGDSFTSYDNAVINGTLTFNVTDTANFGSLVVSNGTADLTNGTLAVGVIGSGLAAGDEIRVIDGNTAIIGGPGATPTVIADTSYLWNFVALDGTAATAATNNTDLFIRAVQDTTATEAASTPNNEAAGQVLQDIALVTTDTTLQQVIANINNAPTQDTVNNILESITPAVDTAIADATTAIAQQGADLIQTRLGDVRAGSGVSSGQLTDALGVWGQVFGQHASQSKRDNIAGYSANTYGFVGGIDTDHLFDNATIGLAVSYGNSAIKSKDANSTRTDINSYQIGLYGDYNLPHNYFISGSVAYGYNDIQSVRRDVGGIAGLTATGDYSADQYTAHIETGKDFLIKPLGAPTITPTIGATYTHLSPDSYTETGAGGANLTVETDTIESLELGLGIQSKWDINQTDGSILSPSVHAGYRYDIIGDTIQSTSNFTGGGASFNTQGADPARGTATIGAGLQYKATSNWTLSAGYDFEIKDDYTAHAGVVRAGYNF